ncbi:aldo/keto reductase [Actinophytocola sp.]|uniref:aldo/keto reductase n=1 Tax=Actinophytocola sp. TaxID=1872138 RepID=UPI0025C04C3C|nr:aldo/keto reductase [Actinophytocola sp.]
MGTSTDEATSFAMLDRYLDAGGSFVDTANCYAWWPAPGNTGGESETVLGRRLARGRRDQVFLATKGGAWVTDPDRWRGSGEATRYSGAGAGTLRRELDESLRRLGTDHVDLYYVHVDDPATPLEETLEALAGLVAAGKIRHLGWSNVRTWRLERVRTS